MTVSFIDYAALTMSERLKVLVNTLISANKINGREDFCKAIGISATTLTNWITGKNKPASESLSKISELYGVSTDWILTGKDSGNKAS
jgi:transcriptional regulator with XRE-family HTH domain